MFSFALSPKTLRLLFGAHKRNYVYVCIVMSALLVAAMTWLKALSPSPVLLPPRRRRPRCVVVVVVVVVAFLCRRGLLRCVAVALFVVVAWVEVLNP